MHQKFDPNIDALLQQGLLQVPDDFTERVMHAVEHLPLPLPLPIQAAPSPRWTLRLQWLALMGSTVAGVAQISGFILGIWTATSAI